MLELKDWLAASDIFSLNCHDDTIRNCVHFDDHEFWFDHFKK